MHACVQAGLFSLCVFELQDARTAALLDPHSSSGDRMAVLEAQVRQLQDKFAGTAMSELKVRHLTDLQEREKEEWKERMRVLQQQLTNSRHECQRLKRESHSGSSKCKEPLEDSNGMLFDSTLHRVSMFPY